eukprot:2238671-Amphidinium_carterae.1
MQVQKKGRGVPTTCKGCPSSVRSGWWSRGPRCQCHPTSSIPRAGCSAFLCVSRLCALPPRKLLYKGT